MRVKIDYGEYIKMSYVITKCNIIYDLRCHISVNQSRIRISTAHACILNFSFLKDLCKVISYKNMNRIFKSIQAPNFKSHQRVESNGGLFQSGEERVDLWRVSRGR